MITRVNYVGDDTYTVDFLPSKLSLITNNIEYAHLAAYIMRVAYIHGVRTWWLKGVACMLTGMVIGKLLQ